MRWTDPGRRFHQAELQGDRYQGESDSTDVSAAGKSAVTLVNTEKSSLTPPRLSERKQMRAILKKARWKVKSLFSMFQVVRIC